MAFATYQPPAQTEGDSFKPSEHLDKPIIVKVNEHRTGIVTEFKPDGGEGLIVDVCDYGNSNTAMDVLWMNGALVDGLKPYVGQTLVIRLTSHQSKANRTYIAVEQATPADIAAAEEYVKKNGDPFAPTLATVPAGKSDVPF